MPTMLRPRQRNHKGCSMTRRIDEHVQFDTSEEQYESKHRDWPKTLAEKDAADARAERLREKAAARARKRVSA